MACSRPFQIYPFHTTHGYVKRDWFFKYPYVPCGWCLNCRVDKANSLNHRCQQELIDKRCGAFVTFTYDDPHLLKNFCRDKNGELVATLSRKDCKQFLDRLNKEIHNHFPDCVLSNHHYKYLIVGEYGEHGQVFDRPHFHALFFGLDFAMCKKAFARAWRGQGNIEVDPILDGAIGYVLDYIAKQQFGFVAKEKYDDNNIQRPFQSHSLHLGENLYLNQMDYIKSHNGCYRWKGKDVPVPVYYKNKYLIDSTSDIKKKIDTYFIHYKRFPENHYDLHDFSINLAKARERAYNLKLEQSGKPIIDCDYLDELRRPDWHKERFGDGVLHISVADLDLPQYEYDSSYVTVYRRDDYKRIGHFKPPEYVTVREEDLFDFMVTHKNNRFYSQIVPF